VTVHHSVVVANNVLMYKMRKLLLHFLSHFIRARFRTFAFYHVPHENPSPGLVFLYVVLYSHFLNTNHVKHFGVSIHTAGRMHSIGESMHTAGFGMI